MNRRITLDMAHEAAMKMGSAKYDEELERLAEQLAKLTTQYVKVHYPFPVLKVIEEYPDYFQKTNRVCIHVIEDNKYLWMKTNVFVPQEKRAFDIAKKHVQPLIELNNEYSKLKTKKSDFVNEMVYVLGRELKYEEKVKQFLPEALPYIEFPTVVQLPALEKDHYSKLRDFIKSIK